MWELRRLLVKQRFALRPNCKKTGSAPTRILGTSAVSCWVVVLLIAASGSGGVAWFLILRSDELAEPDARIWLKRKGPENQAKALPPSRWPLPLGSRQAPSWHRDEQQIVPIHKANYRGRKIDCQFIVYQRRFFAKKTAHKFILKI